MDEFVLLTEQETYFVEYLLGSLVLSSSISEAMVFDNHLTALKFRDMLSDVCDTKCSINTFIN